jgi:hypothetical protein
VMGRTAGGEVVALHQLPQPLMAVAVDHHLDVVTVLADRGAFAVDAAAGAGGAAASGSDSSVPGASGEPGQMVSTGASGAGGGGVGSAAGAVVVGAAALADPTSCDGGAVTGMTGVTPAAAWVAPPSCNASALEC